LEIEIMKLKVTLAIVVVLAALGGLGAVKALQIGTLIKAGQSFRPPPETISSAVARTEKWQATVGAVGSITTSQGVNVVAEIPGSVTEIAFESGAFVEKGALLVRLDTSSEEAQLRALEAQTDLARINAERARKLRAENTVSQSELDTAEATLKQAQANADNVRATIAKKTIRAPFAGRLGIRQVNLGEYVEAGKTTIVSLQALDTVYAEFSLPQQELARLKPGQPVHLTADTYPGKQFEGTLTSLNPDLDANTRAIRLQATFDNKEHLLRPGMFVRAEVLLPGEQDVLIIPTPSVLSAPYGDSVYVITQSTNATGGLVARQQFIRTGRMRGDYVSVEAGLKEGDKVASSGLFKLRNGSSVVENNELTPKTEQAPKPGNS
jgi:membrane fusion protein (multidrug efflux system)